MECQTLEEGTQKTRELKADCMQGTERRLAEVEQRSLDGTCGERSDK